MPQYCLSFEDSINEMEKNREWIGAARLCFQKWQKNPKDLNNLLCAGTQCWYGILAVEHDRLDPNNIITGADIEEECLHTMLATITRWGLEYFSQSAEFNAYFGYMMKTMPYTFDDYNGDYVGWQEKGEAMLRLAVALDSTNLFAQALAYEAQGVDMYDLFIAACRDLWNEITPQQWGNTEVQQYFFRILNGDVFNSKASVK